MRYDAVLLDIDGTLIDSNDAHARAWVDAFAAHGREVAFERVRPLIGMGGDKLVSIVAGLDIETAEGKAVSATRQDIFKRGYLPRLRPTTGAETFLAWLRAQRLKIAVATSADAGELEGLLAVVNATSLAASAASSDDAEESKPDADIVLAALRRTGSRPDTTVMIGDTPYDIEAARRVDVATIALRCGGWRDADLKGAVAVYDNPADLLAHIAESPFVETSTNGANP